MAQFTNRAVVVLAVIGLIAACGNAGGVDTPEGDPESDSLGGSAAGDSSAAGQSGAGGAAQTGGNSAAGTSAAGTGETAGSSSVGGAAAGGHTAGVGGASNGGASSAGKGGMPSSAGGATPGAGGQSFGAGGSSTSVPTSCAESNGTIGCCSADGLTAYFCTPSGMFTAKTCTSSTQCGWKSSGSFYDCGGTGADPAGDNPLVCGGGSGSGGSSSSGNIIPKTCAQAHGDAGCCAPDGNEYYCTSATATTVKMVDCSSKPSCGWLSSSKQYDCGQSGDPDPSGNNPINCGPLGRSIRHKNVEARSVSSGPRGVRGQTFARWRAR